MMLRLGLLLITMATAGCAALPVGMIGAAALSGGANTVARAGTEYTLGGTARRTVSQPADTVHDTALTMLSRLGIKVTEEEREGDGRATLRGHAYERSVAITIEPVSPAMTQFGVTVRRGLARDGATASEILAQLQRALEHHDQGSGSPP